jgi:hypothetical protein
MIDATLARFLEEGLGVHLGTRNDQLEPNGARAIAVKVDETVGHVFVYLADVAAKRVLPDLAANGLAAVVCARPIDERACQLKGTFVASRPATADERPFVMAQWDGFMKQLETIGVSRASMTGWATWPLTVITIKATAVFNQTPGVEASTPIT